MTEDAFRITPTEGDAQGDAPGATLRFPYDSALVERFRKAFPSARWREAEGAWWVPGTRAAARLDRWAAAEQAALDRHADAKGRDAFSFDPLESRYLQAGGEELAVRTPFSRTVVAILRGIPWARWDPDARAWLVPYRSYEALRARWPEIEAAAGRHELANKQPTRDPATREANREKERERRRHRFPVPLSDPPPLEQPVLAAPFGVVVFTGTDGELAEAAEIPALYAHVHADPAAGPFAWLAWRPPTWRELAAAKPGDAPQDGAAIRAWRIPTRAELRGQGRSMRQAERAQATRAARRTDPA